jgi:hypothetical protein
MNAFNTSTTGIFLYNRYICAFAKRHSSRFIDVTFLQLRQKRFDEAGRRRINAFPFTSSTHGSTSSFDSTSRTKAVTPLTAPNNDHRDEEPQPMEMEHFALMDEHRIILEQIRWLTAQLYRRIIRSINKLIRPGNEHDVYEFQLREEKQRQSTTLSLVDSLPIDRKEEMQSRTNYYLQYARENFIQNSDLLADLIQPKLPTKSPLKSSVVSPYHIHSDQQQLECEAELLREEQYDIVERYFYLLRQGEVHRQWLLKDMKFTHDPYADSTVHATTTHHEGGTTTTTTTSVEAALSERIQQYIVRVLQYNYGITMTHTIATSGASSSETTTISDDAAAAALLSGSSNSVVEWSDDDDDDDNH